MMLVPVPVLWNLRHDIPFTRSDGARHPATTVAWDWGAETNHHHHGRHRTTRRPPCMSSPWMGWMGGCEPSVIDSSSSGCSSFFSLESASGWGICE